jgi:hypothetical protein
MRVISCSCGDKFQTPWDVFLANDSTLTPDQKDEFVRWLTSHGTPSHVKKMSLVEVPAAN